MKVLLLTTHLNIGGVAVYTVNLAMGLKKKGHAAYVASSGGELEEKLSESGIPHLRTDLKTKFEFHPKLIPAFFKLFFFIKRNKIDVIHAQTRVAQVLALFLSEAAGVPYVSTCHGFFKHMRFGRRVFGAWGRHVIAISDAVMDHAVMDFGLKRKNVSLIYTGVDADRFSQNIPEGEKELLRKNLGLAESTIIGCISRLSPVKGLKFLLLAFKDLVNEMPQAKLLLVGEGPSRDSLVESAKRLNIEKSVFFAANTSDTRKFLSIMDVFVFYSLKEGLGLSLLEALAAGKACVASNVGGVSSIIEDGKTGLLVPPEDAHLLKEAVKKLIFDRRFSALLAENGKTFVREKFSPEKMVEEVVGVYEKVISEK